jgi:phosphoglycolate phosphatase
MDVLPKLYDRAGPLGLCTNKPIAPTRRILEHLGMARYFGAVFGGDSVPHKKPNPAMLDACRQELGRDRASVVFVGDSGVDEAAARSFGSAFVGVTYGYGAGALSEQALKVDFFPRLLDVFGDLELKKLRV